MQDVTNPVSVLSFYVRKILLSSLILSYFFNFHTIGPTDLHPSPVSHFKTFHKFLVYFLKW